MDYLTNFTVVMIKVTVKSNRLGFLQYLLRCRLGRLE